MKRDIALIVLYKDNDILLQLRSKSNLRYPGKLLLVGGSIEQGESPVKAAKREMMEETGYRIEGSDLLAYIPHPEGDKYVFIEKYDGVQQLKVLDGDSLEWFCLDKNLAEHFLESDKDLLSRIESHVRGYDGS